MRVLLLNKERAVRWLSLEPPLCSLCVLCGEVL